jgi:hypothetical protein
MKSNYKLLVLLMLVGLVACKKYLDTAYVNPNNPVTPPAAEQILPGLIGEMHRGIAFDGRPGTLYVQYMARTSSGDSWERQGYLAGSDAGGELWRMQYFRFGQNVRDIVDNQDVHRKYDYVAVAYTILAWGWLNLADYHGDMIVKQAFNKNLLVFQYDGQEEAYKVAMRLIDTAMYFYDKADQMSNRTLSVGDQYMYGGNLTKWRKFANGVKAKCFHRYFLKSNYAPDSVIKYVNQSFTSVADDALVKFVANPNSDQANFYGPVRDNMGTYRAAAYLMNLLNGTLIPVPDARLKFLFKPAGDGVYRGLNHNSGDFSSTTQRPPSFWGVVSQYSAPAGGIDTGGRYIFKNAAPFPIMTYSELQFIKAEAQLKKNDPGAMQSYKNGIAASFDLLTTYFTGYNPITVDQRDSYVNDPAISGGTLTVKNLMRQKYLALYPYGWGETWVDMRKYNYDTTNVYTGYTIPTGINLFPDNLGKLVQRARPRYNSEYLWNIDALNSVGGLDIDYHTKKVWFQQP